MNRKFFVSIIILLLSIFCTSMLSSQAVLVSILLILIAFVKHKIYPIKKELLWFILISFGGAIVEIIFVNLSNAWVYANSQFFGIPVWIPFFWGVVGTIAIVAYEGLTGK